ncbi:MAG: GuaB3 family IMP dehydrogenase-related protein [bacterium]|jgi:IMP dehydrogenase|nr:GuaB3 family IMP dehydrogenase-related protein [bacterium]MDD4558474.1 GuaB3 family IMP dehydrogenase-related protein [bacterium]
MHLTVGRGRTARRAYGFDEIAIAPSTLTIDPEDTDISTSIGDVKLDVPILAAAMDGVVDVRLAAEMGRLGGLAVLNLEGIQTRYEDPVVVINRITAVSSEEVVALIQEIYREPIKEELIRRRIREMKESGITVAVSSSPLNAERFGTIAAEEGVDLFVVQVTVTSVKFESSKASALSLEKLCAMLPMPVVAGNCVTYEAALELMQTGVKGILVGVGPGAACTTRRVLGIGVPQVTAVADAAAARNEYLAATGNYVAVIADGGMRTGGDICKAIAGGADAVMIGSPIAGAAEAPGRGYHWGMATASPGLPRGTRIRVGELGTLKDILFGPAKTDDGTLNLAGALKTCMGTCGKRNIQELQQVEIVIAPSLPSEGKAKQCEQHVGMGK